MSHACVPHESGRRRQQSPSANDDERPATECEEDPDDWELLEPDDDDLSHDLAEDDPFADEEESRDDWRDEPQVAPDEWDHAKLSWLPGRELQLLVEDFNRLRHRHDAMTKQRRKSLFCEPCGACLCTWRGRKTPRRHLSTGC